MGEFDAAMRGTLINNFFFLARLMTGLPEMPAAGPLFGC